MSLLFIWSGVVGKILGWSSALSYVSGKSLPVPVLWVFSGMLIELVAPLGLLVRRWRTPAALVLCVYSATTAVMFHHFWSAADARPAELQEFLKDLAIAGAFLFIFAEGRSTSSSPRRS